MTTPVDFNTPARIIRMAMEDAGLLQEGDEPNSEQYAKYMERLQDLINAWQTQGLKLFLLQDLTLNLVAGQAAYSLSPTGDIVMTKPLRIIQAYYRDSSGTRRPLVSLGWEEYLRLSTVTQLGAVINYLVDKQPTSLIINLWNVPDATAATGTVHLLTQVAMSFLTELDDTLIFPPEWYMALRWGLADDISTGQPQIIMDRCKMKADEYRTALENWDVEDAATRFVPDSRTGSSYSLFK